MSCKYKYKGVEYSEQEIIQVINKDSVNLSNQLGLQDEMSIYLNKDVATNETKVHEFSHLHLDYLKKSRPKVYKRGLTLIEAELEKDGTLEIENKEKDVEIDTDNNGESIFEKRTITNFSIDFNNEARAFGNIDKNIASITQINAPKGVLGNKTYERVLNKLKSQGVTSLEVKLQSKDSRATINALIKKGILTNPRQLTGVSTDQYPTLFDINYSKISEEVSEIQDIIDFVKTSQPNLTGEALTNEILTELLGRDGLKLINELKAKKGGILDWLKEVWAEIKSMWGISDMTDAEIMELTLGEYARKMSVSILKGNNIADTAQQYFTRNADRLPLTLVVFSRPEFVKLQGKQVNPITVLNSLNQSGIKQIEKDLIKQVIEDNYKGQAKINYDELEATVRANIMPLERLTTSSYATYGMDNLGNGNYGKAKTLILNSPIAHGVTGHFSNDFKASKRQNIKYQAKQLDANTWVAVEEGYESQANDNNIYQYVGTAGTKEAVDAWINSFENQNKFAKSAYIVYEDTFYKTKDYNNAVEPIEGFKTKEEAENYVKENTSKYEGGLDYQTQSDFSGNLKSGLNKGMFGHIRVWETPTEKNTTSVSKEQAQKLISEGTWIYTKKGEELYRLYDEGDLNDATNYVKRNNIFHVAELQSDFFQKFKAKDRLLAEKEKYYLTEESINSKKDFFESNGIITKGLNNTVDVDKTNTLLYKDILELEKGLSTDNTDIKNDKIYREISKKEAVKEALEQFNKGSISIFDYIKTFNKKGVEDYQKNVAKAEEKYLENSLSPQEKQFIASQKIWEQRMVREAIKEASLSGATSLRFPTPYTLSVIEGYIRGNDGVEKAPYTAVSATNENKLEKGDVINYLGEDYIVFENTETSIKVVPKKADITDEIIKDIKDFKSSQAFLEENKLSDEKYFYKGVILPIGVVYLEMKQAPESFNEESDSQDVFESATIEEYFNKYKKQVEDFTGETYTEKEWKELIEDSDGVVVQRRVHTTLENATKDFNGDGIPNVAYTPTQEEIEADAKSYADQYSIVNGRIVDTSGNETLSQPDRYTYSKSENFNISDLSEEQQTVARKYLEIAEILKKEKPVELVTDENGFDWYEAQIEQSDVNKPVVAFQKTNEEVNIKANEYLSRLNKVKEEDPTNYWSVDVPSLEVVKDAVQNDRLVEVDGGMAIVTDDGSLIGLFKDNPNAKNIAQQLQELRVQKGGYKLDNFDGYLTKIYEKNGFRVVSRLAFNEKEAPEGYNKKLHGTPDVVFMIYDPNSRLDIRGKSFSKDQYDEAEAYRDSFSEQAKTNLSTVAIEPNLSFETPKGETFDNYSDALKNTDEGTIKLKIDEVVIGEVTSSTDINTVVGSINDLVKQGILKGERLLNPNGTISLVTEGNSLAKKLINASISEELFLGNKVKPSMDERGDISIAEKQSFYEENRDLDYKQIKAKHGADIANIVLAARVYEENTKAFGQKRLIEDIQEITPENELQEQLLNLLNTLGVKTVSLNKYKENYKQRNGVLPSSNSLADIANRVIAFTNGEVTQDALTEEVAHFILEAVNQDELVPLLENIHKTDEWAQYAEEYFKIYQDEAVVRKEILGKVLKNAIQRNFEKSQQTGTANTIIGKLAEIFNKFFTRISEFFTPQHRIDLDEYTKKIYDNLMLGGLVDELNQEQLEGNNLVLFQTSNTIQSEADLLLSKLNKILEQVEAQDRRLNSVSKEEILTLKEALKVVNIDNEEAEIARATLSISNIANRQINYLAKRDKRNLLSSEESAVFSLTVGYLSKVLTELESTIGKKTTFPNKVLITKVLAKTLESIRKLQGDVAISQEQNVERIFDKVSEELDLDDTTKKQLLDNFNNITRDTNVFYAYVGGAINAHNPALNIASALISKAYADRDIAFNVKSKEFINLAKSKGYTEEQLSGLMKKWKRGHHLFSRFDFQKLEKDMLDEKVKLFKEVFGKEVTADQLLKNEDTLLKAEVTDKKKIYYKRVNDFRQENQVYSPLTEEETKKSNAIYTQVSLETQMKDKELSRQRSAITREAKRNGSFSEAQKFEMEELVRKRAKLKDPFDNEGRLKVGLTLNEEDEVVIASEFTIDTLEADSKLTYELNLLDKLKAENFKNSLQETALPKKFIDALNAIKGEKEKLEFIKLNANISFSSDFWNTFDRSEGVASKLREKGEFTIADYIQKLTTRRKHILKASRVFNNPSETDFEDLSGETILSLIEIEKSLEDNYNAANKILDKEDRVRNKMSESVVNQAYKNELEDRDITTTSERIDFIKKHVTDTNKNKIESARLAVEAYRSGVRRDLPKALQPFISSEEDLDIDKVLITYAETKLASYFKKLQPVGFNYDTLLVDIASDPEVFFKNMPQDVSVTPNYIFLGQEENSRVNPKFAKNIEEGEPQLQLYDKSGNIKYGNKEFADYFGIANLESPKATKNEKEYELLQALYKFQDDTINKADMKDKHSRYLLPQKRPEILNRIANIKADKKGNLKEGFKELFAYREDDAIYGQTDGKMRIGEASAIGEMTIPRHGFNRMESEGEVTDELLYSYMWMAQEAELRKSRVGILGDIESIRTILANKSYGDKHGEATATYNMFDDFVRFNMYGQSESFSFETNFGILSKKVNLAPLIKKFQWWIRLVNLGFSVLTPLTSFLQGSVNFQIEKFVGERIDKDASRLARKQLVKLLPESMSDVMKITSSSKLNIISEFMGQDSSLERFKNSNYSRLTRGIASSAYMTHAAADVPLSAQVMLTVLHDFRVVNGKLMTFAKFAEENKSKTRKEARTAWAAYEDKALFNYIKIENGVASITDELKNIVPDIDKRMQNVRNSITVAKQEVDSQISSTDRTKMQRHALLSFLTLHKGWLITSMTRRFKSKHLNLYTGLEEEGSYSGTFGSDSFFSDLVQSWKKDGVSFKAVKENWKNSSVTRRRSLQRVASDIAVTNALVLVALLLKNAADDDDDKDYATQFAAYMSYRLANEVTSQSTGFSNQIYKFLQSPTTGLTQIQNVLDITDLVSPNIIESGMYKDLSKSEAWFFKSLPALKEYWKLTNIDRTRKSYEFFNAPAIDYFTIAGVMMKEDKEKEE